MHYILSAFQAVVVYLAAILLYTNVISLTNNTNHILLAILSFAFGIQFASTKLLHPLGCSAIPGQVITGKFSLLIELNIAAVPNLLFQTCRMHGGFIYRPKFILRIQRHWN